MYNHFEVCFKSKNQKYFEGLGITTDKHIQDINDQLKKENAKDDTYLYVIRNKTLYLLDKRSKEYKKLNKGD